MNVLRNTVDLTHVYEEVTEIERILPDTKANLGSSNLSGKSLIPLTANSFTPDSPLTRSGT